MKKLYLAEADRKIGGVCGGIAEYFSLDPTVVRLVAIVVCLVTGLIPLLIGYLVAWAIIPRKVSP